MERNKKIELKVTEHVSSRMRSYLVTDVREEYEALGVGLTPALAVENFVSNYNDAGYPWRITADDLICPARGNSVRAAVFLYEPGPDAVDDETPESI